MVPIEVPIHKYFSEPPNYNPDKIPYKAHEAPFKALGGRARGPGRRRMSTVGCLKAERPNPCCIDFDYVILFYITIHICDIVFYTTLLHYAIF